MTVIILIISTAVLLLFSVLKSRRKTVEGLKAAKSMMISTFIEVAGIMAIVGLVLALLPPELIRRLLGSANTALSIFFGALIGTATIMPAVIAFPLSNSLYQSGADLAAIAAFLTTLTMVGIATAPIEVKTFGGRFTLFRNSLSFAAALLIALAMGRIL